MFGIGEATLVKSLKDQHHKKKWVHAKGIPLMTHEAKSGAQSSNTNPDIDLVALPTSTINYEVRLGQDVHV